MNLDGFYDDLDGLYGVGTYFNEGWRWKSEEEELENLRRPNMSSSGETA